MSYRLPVARRSNYYSTRQAIRVLSTKVAVPESFGHRNLGGRIGPVANGPGPPPCGG
jgi:hypothetical protein